MEIQTLTGGISRHNQAKLPFFDRRFDIVPIYRSEIAIPEKPVFPRACINGHCLTGQNLRELGTYPEYGVIKLAENDAPVLKPSSFFGAMLRLENVEPLRAWGRGLRGAKARRRLFEDGFPQPV